MRSSDATVALVMACGNGGGLGQLTRSRTKAAVPFGGEYRIIDFVLSNCLHSGLRRMQVFTESKSHSLQGHLRDGWNIFNSVLGQYVMPVGPQMQEEVRPYRGDADAIAQNWRFVRDARPEQVLVLQGEHVYRMDYAAMASAHVEAGNDVTVACVPAGLRTGEGWVRVESGENGRVTRMEAQAGAGPATAPEADAWAAMEVVLFESHVLQQALEIAREADALIDLHRDVLPLLVEQFKVGSYHFGGSRGRVTQDRYWTDMATLDDYFRAHLGLLEPVPLIDMYQSDWAIWSYPGKNPPARTVSSARGNEGIFVNSIVSNGTVIVGGAVSQSVLCPRVRVEDSATVERCVLLSGVTVGQGSQLRNCVVDKRVDIPAGVSIGFDQEQDEARFGVSSAGVVVIPEGHEDW